MKNESTIIEYLHGRLNEDQQKDFKHRLASDQDLHQEYIMIKRLIAYDIDDKYKEAYNAEIDILNAKHFPSNQSKTKISNSNKIILALIILLIIITSWYLLRPKNVNLYDDNSNHFALHLVTKSEENSAALNAENAFNKRNFDLASIELVKYLEKNSIDTKARLALGICYLEQGKSSEAFQIFEAISEGKSTLKDYAIWYKALYYVKNLEYEKAKALLLTIPKRDTMLYTNAQKLIDDIENVK